MRTKVQKWGNSLAVRIPSAFVKETQLACGSPVDISVDCGRLVIDPTVVSAYDLDELLEDVESENLHEETETGDAVGGEVW